MPRPMVKLVAVLLMWVQAVVASGFGRVQCIDVAGLPVSDAASSLPGQDRFAGDSHDHDLSCADVRRCEGDAGLDPRPCDHRHTWLDLISPPIGGCGCHVHVPVPGVDDAAGITQRRAASTETHVPPVSGFAPALPGVFGARTEGRDVLLRPPDRWGGTGWRNRAQGLRTTRLLI